MPVPTARRRRTSSEVTRRRSAPGGSPQTVPGSVASTRIGALRSIESASTSPTRASRAQANLRWRHSPGRDASTSKA
jgi:hypothetical protein